MMSPIGLYLAEFAPRPVPPHLTDQDLSNPGTLEAEALCAADAFRLQQIRGEGFADGRAAAEAEHATQIATLESRHTEQLATERQHWAETEGSVLADRLGKGLSDLERRLGDALVQILEPFIERSLCTKAVAELQDAIRRLLGNDAETAVQITGPADIVEPLRLAFEGRPGVKVTAAETPEVTVLARDTTIVSQLEAWRSGLTLDVREDR